MTEAQYERRAREELKAWRERVLRPPGPWDRATRGVQDRIIAVTPDKVHAAVTAAMQQMTRGVMAGSDLTTPKPLQGAPLSEREARVRDRVRVYRAAAAAEGGVAGAGGFLLAAVDFPALIGIKIKLLFEIAALYGHSGKDFAERLFILLVFQLAFSSARGRAEVLERLEAWVTGPRPSGFDDFDWRRFQQEYRDYIDLAKLAQLLPVVGAPVGAVVNFRLVERLGETAMAAYRLRWFRDPAPDRGPAGLL